LVWTKASLGDEKVSGTSDDLGRGLEADSGNVERTLSPQSDCAQRVEEDDAGEKSFYKFVIDRPSE
jgi:hypothetical protein